MDERKSTVAQAEANVAGSEAALEAASLNLNFTKVTSPITGRVSRAEVTRGNLVTGGSNGGTLLTSVVSMDPIYLYFDGDEQSYLRYTQMARGGERPSSRDARNPVQVGLANEEGFPHAGTVDFVDNQLNPQTGTIRARAVLENKDGQFTPGMFARVQLLGSGEYSADLDRGSCRQYRSEPEVRAGARRQQSGRISQRKLGRVIDGLRVVREGLKAGDVIVVNGAQRVHPGVTVTPQTGDDGRRRRRRAAPRSRPRRDEYFLVLHRAADIRDGARDLDHRRRPARHAGAADQRIPGNRAAHRGGQRSIPRRLAEDDCRDGHHAARAADQRRGKRDLHEFHRDARRHLHDHGDVQARAPISTSRRCRPRTGWRRRRRACRRSCARSGW